MASSCPSSGNVALGASLAGAGLETDSIGHWLLAARPSRSTCCHFAPDLSTICSSKVCCTSFSGSITLPPSSPMPERMYDKTSIAERPFRSGAIIGWMTLYVPS